MKKLWICVLFGCLFFVCSLHAKSINSLGLKLDLSSDHKLEFPGGGDDTYDIEKGTGVSLVFESLADQYEWACGIGFEFFLPHEIDVDHYDPKFSFIPIYFVISSDLDASVAVMGRIGYNVSFTGNDDYKGDADLSGGIYLGVGVGGYFEQARIEFMYSMYQGEMDFEGWGTIDVTHTEFSFVVAFLF